MDDPIVNVIQLYVPLNSARNLEKSRVEQKLVHWHLCSLKPEDVAILH